MTDNPYSHLEAIELRLSHERQRLDTATKERERQWRAHNVAMIEREHANEVAFLEKRGIAVKPVPLDDIIAAMSDDELLAELLAP